jgi:hypothetical protein
LTGAEFIWALSKKAADSVAPKGTSVLSKTTEASTPADTWEPSTLYSLNDEVIANGQNWLCASFPDGTSAATGTGPSGVEVPPVTDGTAIWEWISTVTSTPGDIVITTPASGIVTITLDPADTAALAGEFYHELELTQAGIVSTVLFGQVTIVKDLIQ